MIGFNTDKAGKPLITDTSGIVFIQIIAEAFRQIYCSCEGNDRGTQASADTEIAIQEISSFCFHRRTGTQTESQSQRMAHAPGIICLVRMHILVIVIIYFGHIQMTRTCADLHPKTQKRMMFRQIRIHIRTPSTLYSLIFKK